MANITFNCTQCGQSLTIDDSAAGMQVQCPACATSLRVPGATKAQIVAPAAARQAPGIFPATAPATPGVQAAPAPATPPAPGSDAGTLMRVFFIVAFITFLLPAMTFSGTNTQSPFDMLLSLPNKVPSGAGATLKAILVNGFDMAKDPLNNNQTSMVAMLGVVLLWITSIGFLVYFVMTIVCAIQFFRGQTLSNIMLFVTLACAVQFIPLTLIANSLIRAGVESRGTFLNGNIIAPAWGLWTLAAACVMVVIWPKVSACCRRSSES